LIAGGSGRITVNTEVTPKRQNKDYFRIDHNPTGAQNIQVSAQLIDGFHHELRSFRRKMEVS